MVKNRYLLKRKKIIVFGFEGKNNKTETLYFSHFKPFNDDYILKTISCGCTDLQNMITSIKQKRSAFDYKSNEDKTFLFVDVDCNLEKHSRILSICSKLPKDITVVLSSPSFELWFLNHFLLTTRDFRTNDELIKELKKYIPNYGKNVDIFHLIEKMHDVALINSQKQMDNGNVLCFSDVHNLFKHKILKKM